MSHRGHSRYKAGYLAGSLDGVTLCTLHDLILEPKHQQVISKQRNDMIRFEFWKIDSAEGK